MSPCLEPTDTLIIVDVQNGFCRGGALPVLGGDEVLPVLNRWIQAAERAGALIVASRDWHPADHVSFRDRGGPWPVHCVQGTPGAEFHSDLRLPADAIIVSKATSREQESYSAFGGTGLGDLLRQRGVSRVWVGGLAQDYCVRATALDALREGFEVHLIEEATCPVSAEGGRRAIEELAAAGCFIERGGT